MALHKDFPNSPYAILNPDIRWFPADETLRETSADKLMPPLVAELRKKVKAFRDSNYAGASETSKSLLIKKYRPKSCLLYTSPSPRDLSTSRMPSSA